MQVRHVLTGAAVGDEAIAARLEIELYHEVPHRGEKVLQEFGILCADGSQVGQTASRHENDMYGIGRLRMVEGQRLRVW